MRPTRKALSQRLGQTPPPTSDGLLTVTPLQGANGPGSAARAEVMRRCLGLIDLFDRRFARGRDFTTGDARLAREALHLAVAELDAPAIHHIVPGHKVRGQLARGRLAGVDRQPERTKTCA